MNETQIKDLALLLVIKQARARGWDTIHVAPKLRLFLTVPVRDSTVRSQHCPVLRCVWFRKEKLIRDYVSLPAPECCAADAAVVEDLSAFPSLLFRTPATEQRSEEDWPWSCSSPWKYFSSVQFSSVAQSCPTLCDPMNHSTPGLPVHHQLPEFTQTHVHRVGDAIQPSHPLSSPCPPAPNPSQHQSVFQ